LNMFAIKAPPRRRPRRIFEMGWPASPDTRTHEGGTA